METNRPVFAVATAGNLLLRAELFDVGEVGVAAEEQLVDHHFARDVFNLAAAEVVGKGQHLGITLG